MSLQNFQIAFAETIFSNEQKTSLVQPEANLSIYQNNVITNLLKVLKDIYPMILQLVGADFFHILTEEYIHHYPSSSGNLHDYGEYFSDFLMWHASTQTLPYLAEVAQFEWICHTLYFAAEHEPLQIKTLENIVPAQYEQLYFILHPASYVRKFDYPLLRIIELCKGKTEELIDINAAEVNLLLVRREVEIALVLLTVGEYYFLKAIQDNLSLSAALEAAMAMDADFALEKKLPVWIRDKIIVDFYL